MKKIAIIAALAALLTFAIGTAHAAMFDFVEVDDVSNGNDSLTGFGNVDSCYRIGTTEVTNDQYAEFLNAIAKSDPNGAWHPFMDISRSGSDGSYVYTVDSHPAVAYPPLDTSYGSHPIRGVSFFNAMRFVNWVENGQPTGAQGPGTTEDGTYTITDGFSETRAPGATYFLPSEDEWYKAAYYSLDDGDGDPGYWLYPTQSDLAPTAEVPTGGANSANFAAAVGDTTHVGAYTGTTSYYGGFDFGGNVTEWTEGVSGMDRIVRGGSHVSSELPLRSTIRDPVDPALEGSFAGDIGFRIATVCLVATPFVPEPGTATLALIATLLMMMVSSRRFHRRNR